MFISYSTSRSQSINVGSQGKNPSQEPEGNYWRRDHEEMQLASSVLLSLRSLKYIFFHEFFCLCTMCVPGTDRSQKEASATLELELQMDASHHKDAENQTLVLWKTSQGSYPLSQPLQPFSLLCYTGQLQLPRDDVESWVHPLQP